MRLSFATLFAFIGASAAWADPTAGDACAQKLTPDSKKIYDQVVTSKPTQSNLLRVTEDVTRELAQKNAIDASRARNSAGPAYTCSAAYLK